jgi:hypothetical protein
MNVVFLVALFFVSFTTACHPECTSTCSSTVCPAVCDILAKPINCSIRCVNAAHVNSCRPVECRFGPVPRDQCEQDSCPQLEVLCEAPVCNAAGANCEIQCAAVQAGWDCHTPPCWEKACPVECGLPACAADPETMTVKVSDSVFIAPSSMLLFACIITLCAVAFYAPDGPARYW